MTKINFRTSPQDQKLIEKIAKRAIKLAKAHGIDYEIRDALMDITATHANGNPLRLKEMLEADDFNFAHDVFGIRRHMNRETGKLMAMFSPRYTYHEGADFGVVRGRA